MNKIPFIWLGQCNLHTNTNKICAALPCQVSPLNQRHDRQQNSPGERHVGGRISLTPEPRSRALEVNTKERVNLRSRPIASSRSLAEDNSIGNLRPKHQFRRLIGLCRRLEPRDVAYQAPTYNPPAGPFSQLDSILPSLTLTSHSESPAQLRSHIETAKRRSSLSSRGTVFPPSSSVAVNIGIKSPTLRTSESKTPPICLLFLL